MTYLIITLIFGFTWSFGTSVGFVWTEKYQVGQTIIEERQAGEFKVEVSEISSPPRIRILVIGKDQSQGELEFLKSGGDEWGQEEGSYQFIDDLNFRVVKVANRYFPGAEPDDPTSGVSMEEFLAIDDPRDIVDRQQRSEAIAYYQIDQEGQISEVRREYKLVTFELSGLNRLDLIPKDRLRILRNTIYAKLGYSFKSAGMKAYFSQKSWYQPRYDNVDHLLTELDKEIITYIQKLEGRK